MGYAKPCEFCKLNAVFGLHIAEQCGVSSLNARPCVVQMIGPYAVFKAILPCVIAGSNGRMILADEHGLDTC